MLAASQLLLQQPLHPPPINPLAASAPELCGGSLILAAAWKRHRSAAVFPPSGCQLRHSKKQTCRPPTGSRGGASARTPLFVLAHSRQRGGGGRETAGFSGALMGGQGRNSFTGRTCGFHLALARLITVKTRRQCRLKRGLGREPAEYRCCCFPLLLGFTKNKRN